MQTVLYRNYLPFVLILLLMGNVLQAQVIHTTPSTNTSQTVNQALAANCITIDNILLESDGSVDGIESFGSFQAANSNFPFQSGFVLTTGKLSEIGNSTITSDLSQGTTSWPGDHDLEAALGISNTLNATSLTFEVSSATGILAFNYIMASDEYQQDFPCNVSDGFALLIRPLGTSAWTNMAVIPNTSTPVGIETVHPEIIGQCPAAHESHYAGSDLGDTNFDGRTSMFHARADVNPNQVYELKMVVADQLDTRYDTAVFVEAGSLQAEIDLGPDITSCTPVTLDTHFTQGTNYQWYLDDSAILGANNPTYNASSSGRYRAEVLIGSGGTSCLISNEINVTIEPESLNINLADNQLCENAQGSSDATIHILELEAAIQNQLTFSNPDIEFYRNTQDAHSRTNPIQNDLLTSSLTTPTLVVRIENLDTGCYGYADQNLVVNPLPVLPDTIIELCDEDNNGQVLRTFSQLAPAVSNDPNLSISFHVSTSDAENNINHLTGQTTVTQGEQFIVRLEDNTTGCVHVSQVSAQIDDTPVILTDNIYIDACDPDQDGFATFDLTSVVPSITSSTAGLSFSYHLSLNNAIEGINPIANPTSFDNTTALHQEVFIRVTDNLSGCPSIVTLALYPNYLLYESLIEDRNLCDDPSNDGIASADLEEMAVDLANGLVVNIEFYRNANDRQNRVNEIDRTQPFTVNGSTTIYLIIENATCTEYAAFRIYVEPYFQPSQIEDLTYCDPEADGVADINLDDYEDEVSANLGANVSFLYYLTLQDAQNETNPISNLNGITGNSITIYANIENQAGCHAVQPLTINLAVAPQTNVLEPLMLCDDNHDGELQYDLTSLHSDIIIDPNVVFSHHETRSDAVDNTRQIGNPVNYRLSTGQVYFRVSYPSTGCFTIVEQDIDIGHIPDISGTPPLVQCEQDTDGRASFVLADQTGNILSGRSDLTIEYYESASDASTQQNAMDPDASRNNTNNPEQIFFRVYETDRPECFGIDSFELIVDELPDYNAPMDIETCDDDFDDTLTFSLDDIRDQMRSGHTSNSIISFHHSRDDADDNLGAITSSSYRNTVNPQTLFIRIDNNTLCYQIEQVELRVKQKPFVQSTEALVSCNSIESDYAVFDLTSKEEEITGSRSFNNRLTWHLTRSDAESGEAEIPDPTLHQTSNPTETVFLRVYNVVSGCQSVMDLELISVTPPPVNDLDDQPFCDDGNNRIDFTQFSDLIYTGTEQVEVSFYSDRESAIEGNPAISMPHRITQTPEVIFARVEDTSTGCFSLTNFSTWVVPKPTIVSSSFLQIEECDDDYDGIRSINLTRLDETVLNGRSSSFFDVQYFYTQLDAEENILSITREEFMDGDTAFAKVTNLTTGCSAIQEVPIVIHTPPDVPVSTTEYLCEGYLYLDMGITGSRNTYEWSTGETSPAIEITEPGRYWVEITSGQGCVSPRAYFDVEVSGPPTIISATTVDFSDPNTITVQVEGLGDWIYILDDHTVQESARFTGVRPGFHTIEVRDKNGCGPSAFREVLILDYPKFFTPNADGYNNTWKIDNLDRFSSATIHIFDRYGKLLAQISPDDEGWDGTYAGAQMPSDDYWFKLVVKDEERSFKVRGHFTLKR